MLDEKTMVADTLTAVNGELLRYSEMIHFDTVSSQKKRS